MTRRQALAKVDDLKRLESMRTVSEMIYWLQQWRRLAEELAEGLDE